MRGSSWALFRTSRAEVLLNAFVSVHAKLCSDGSQERAMDIASHLWPLRPQIGRQLPGPARSSLWVRRHFSTPSVQRPRPPCARALPYGRKSTQQQRTTSVWCWSAQARMPACLLRKAPPPRQRRRGGGRPPPTGRTGATYGCRLEQIEGWPPVSAHACTPMGARRACV